MKSLAALLLLAGALFASSAPKIIDKPIDYGPKRVELTKAYIKQHYGMNVRDVTIKPRIIVLHWTGGNSMRGAYNTFKPPVLRGRKYIRKAGALNVSAHYLVDRDGTIYRLMPDNKMARHVIGLNYSAIGVENVGGVNNKQDLTKAQVKANIDLVRYLKRKYPHIDYLIGHYEYKKMEKTRLWLEKDKGYRTSKTDPGRKFMKEVRAGVRDLHLRGVPGKTSKTSKASKSNTLKDHLTRH
jgi:beta-N-acetylhexosaminidase